MGHFRCAKWAKFDARTHAAGNNPYVSISESATGVAVDASGYAYVAGNTASLDFPITVGAFQSSPASGSFITKLNTTGSALIYSTYLGSGSTINAIAVDSTGRVSVTGVTGYSGAGHPTTSNAYSTGCHSTGGFNADFFMTELAESGNQLIYSTCFAISNDVAYGAIYGYKPKAIAADLGGRVYVAGGVGCTGCGTSGFPTTANAYQTVNPGLRPAGFVSIFDTLQSGASSLVYSTYFGIPSNVGNNYGVLANAISVDSVGSIYFTGWAGDGMPTTPGAFQSISGGGSCNPFSGAQVPCPDAFVAKLNPSASGTQSLIYLTYLGGPNSDSGNAIAVDGAGNAYVTGNAGSSNFPVTAGTFQTNPAGSPLFVTKLNAGGSKLIYSTFLSGNVYANSNSANGIAVDSIGNAYVAGVFRAQALSTFPVTPDAFQSSFSKTSGDFSEAFLTKLNAAGSSLLYSTYLGGSGDDVATSVAIDQTGDAYVAGYTGSANFPISGNAFQPLVHGTGDAFVTKFPLSGVFRLLGLGISRVGNVGEVTPTVFGSGFHPGITLSLTGPQSISASQVVVGPGGRFLYPTFNLAGVPPGLYSLTAVDIDGTTLTVPNSLTVEQGGTSDVWMDIVGRSVIRGGREQLYTIQVGNRGTADRTAQRVWVVFPAIFGYKVVSGSPPSVLGQLDSNWYLAFDFPRVSAGETQSIVLGLTLPDNPIYAHQTFQVQGWRQGR